jgi:ribosomal protein S13
MRFENILHIYWTKGIFISGKLYYFDSTPEDITEDTYALNNSFSKLVKNRFEFPNYYKHKKSSFLRNEDKFRIKLSRPMNLLLSQLLSVNNNAFYLVKLRIIYYYLQRTYKGRCHAIGKPVRGQRTWSNAWTSFKYNNILRFFISSSKKKHEVGAVNTKINFKITKKKYGNTAPSKQKKTASTKKLHWY